MSNEMNLWRRLKGETPRFFKRIINYAIGTLAVGTSILGLPELPFGITMPSWLLWIAGKMVIIGTVAALISKTTIINTNSKQKKSPIMPTCNFIVWNLGNLEVFTGINPETYVAEFSDDPAEAYCFSDRTAANTVANLLGANQFIGGRPDDRH